MPLPLIPILGAAAGVAQTIFGGNRANQNEKKLEKMINSYQPNQAIMDYYSKALNRYSANPYTSAGYNQAAQQIQRGTAQGISALGDKRSTLAGLGSLIQSQNDSLLKAGAMAEDRQAQAFGQLGGATQMKAGEDKYKFEMKANLLGQKAAGGAAIMNAGIGNVFNSLDSIANMDMIRKFYGGGNSRASSGLGMGAAGAAAGYGG